MPFIEYMLLAILGSSPAAATGTAPMRTLTADAVTQPSGGAEGNLDFNAGITLPGQDTGGCKGASKLPTTGKKPLHHQTLARRHRRGHKTGKVVKTTTTRNSTSKS